jgi:hypothetical protein
MKPEAAGMISEPFEGVLLDMAKSCGVSVSLPGIRRTTDFWY